MSRPFHAAYLQSGMQAGDFLRQGFGDPAARLARVKAAAARTVAPALLAELRAQNEALPPSPARDAHLARLAQGGTAVVITGQQVGLFLGPLYTVFKAASAIAVARTLAAETGVSVVPLFWLQTEDQDFAEMATCLVPRTRAAPLRLTLAEDPSRERCSIADRHLGPEVVALIDQLAESLEGLPRSAEVIDLLRQQYRPGVEPGRAFAGVLASLFAEDGLLLYDPRQATAARLVAPVIRTSLVEAPRFEAALLERSRQLDDAGFAVQIPVREHTTLAFFHLRDARGPRYRLNRQPNGFTLPTGEVLSTDEVLATLEREPLRFSTSALLRPIAQDTLFPTAVYVGGPAEVDYFAQLTPLYEAFGMTPPLVALRARFRVLFPRVRGLLDKLGLSSADLDRPIGELREAGGAKPVTAPGTAPSPAWLTELEGRLDAYARQLPPGDRALTRSVERTRQTARRALLRLEGRHRALGQVRDASRDAQLDEVARWLRPGGAPQERTYSFPAFAARVGLAEFRAGILRTLVPLDPAVREIEL